MLHGVVYVYIFFSRFIELIVCMHHSFWLYRMLEIVFLLNFVYLSLILHMSFNLFWFHHILSVLWETTLAKSDIKTMPLLVKNLLQLDNIYQLTNQEPSSASTKFYLKVKDIKRHWMQPCSSCKNTRLRIRASQPVSSHKSATDAIQD